MTWYAVTDSDWEWDGADLKVASLELLGFGGFTKDEDGVVIYEPFVPADEGQSTRDDHQEQPEAQLETVTAEGMRTPGRRAMSV